MVSVESVPSIPDNVTDDPGPEVSRLHLHSCSAGVCNDKWLLFQVLGFLSSLRYMETESSVCGREVTLTHLRQDVMERP